MNQARKWPHRAALLAATVIAAGVLPLSSAGTAAAAPTNTVLNTGTISIGALRNVTSPPPGRPYDDLIPPGQYSGYPFTGGVYVGPDHCLRIRRVLSGGGTSDPRIVQGPKTEPLSSGINYEIRGLAKTNSLCRNL
ncbi:hypothetical protein OHS59_02085 [Streptomyces sp. NBC_00414]|uniref:hypothetical protein n=1 Tax=Streptomyces sp. NBC_00414 TaxID=2975739 RepID=UPI002E1B3728